MRVVTSSLHAVTDLQRYQTARAFPDERGLGWLNRQIVDNVVSGMAAGDGRSGDGDAAGSPASERLLVSSAARDGAGRGRTRRWHRQATSRSRRSAT
jgi:hypothetical protein